MGLCSETRGFVKGIACASYSSPTTEMGKKSNKTKQKGTAFLLSILISFWKGICRLWSSAVFKKKKHATRLIQKKKPCLNLLMFFSPLSHFPSLPPLPSFSLSVNLSYSLPSFSMPLALQAVVCFVALMCFFRTKQRKKKAKQKKTRNKKKKKKQVTEI